MDRIDYRILELLQHDAAMEVTEIAERVGLSKAPCWRRIRRLEESGIIRKKVALLDPKLLNVGTTVFVTVKTADHGAAWRERFFRTLDGMPEVTEVYRVIGNVEYLLRIVVPDIDAYGVVYGTLIETCQFLDISASVVLATPWHTTALPLGHVPR